MARSPPAFTCGQALFLFQLMLSFRVQKGTERRRVEGSISNRGHQSRSVLRDCFSVKTTSSQEVLFAARMGRHKQEAQKMPCASHIHGSQLTNGKQLLCQRPVQQACPQACAIYVPAAQSGNCSVSFSFNPETFGARLCGFA